MTPKQKKVLDWIKAFIDENGFSPSYDEIADAVGIASRSGAHRTVKILIKTGYLRQNGNARGLEVISKGEDRIAKIRNLMEKYDAAWITELEFTLGVRRILMEQPA